MDMTATLLSELVSSVYPTDWGKLDLLSPEIDSLSIKCEFVLELGSFLIFGELHDVVIVGKCFNSNFKELEFKSIPFHFIFVLNS